MVETDREGRFTSAGEARQALLLLGGPAAPYPNGPLELAERVRALRGEPAVARAAPTRVLDEVTRPATAPTRAT